MMRNFTKFLFTLLILLGCSGSKNESYNDALLRVKNFLAFTDSATKSSTSIHQLQYYLAQSRDSLQTKIIPYLDSISRNLNETQTKNIKTLKIYLELYLKESKSAEDISKLEKMRKEVEKILEEAKAK
uniref:Lipoprotein n=1 Tax=candidate division WOR-3 bacterium TaxID=2052148 RepID=A0A7C2P0F1_UNCW3